MNIDTIRLNFTSYFKEDFVKTLFKKISVVAVIAMGFIAASYLIRYCVSKKRAKIQDPAQNNVKPGKSPIIHTLGDSTLDNVYWLLNASGSNAESAKELSTEGQIEKVARRIFPNSHLISHAFDGATSWQVVNGGDIGDVLGIKPNASHTPKQAAYLNNRRLDPKAATYMVDPTASVINSITTQQEAVHYVAISVGGNDLRACLANPAGVFDAIARFHRNYKLILEMILSFKETCKVYPILILQYPVDANNDQLYGVYRALQTLCKANPQMISQYAKESPKRQSMALMSLLFKQMYTPILHKAKEHNLPVLDLTNTFDPHANLYIQQIEPNEQGSKLIGEGVGHILEHHDFNGGSKIYAKKKDATEYSGSVNEDPNQWNAVF